jgi:hypothetical protein
MEMRPEQSALVRLWSRLASALAFCQCPGNVVILLNMPHKMIGTHPHTSLMAALGWEQPEEHTKAMVKPSQGSSGQLRTTFPPMPKSSLGRLITTAHPPPSSL